MKDCPLWPFRFGKNPYRVKRQLTDEQKERLRKQLAKGRAKQAQKPKGVIKINN
jgi:Zn-dependent M16 (insulinase) family peptidase